MADLQFPFQAYLQAKQQQQQNWLEPYQLIGQAISQAGQTGGQILQARAQQQKQAKLAESLKNTPLAPYANVFAQDPSLLGQLGPELLKPQKPQMEWSPVSGFVTNEGQPLVVDKTTGQMRPADIPGGVKSTAYGPSMQGLRRSQYTLKDLPSNQGPGTASGAAYQVKVATRQLKALIAKATNPQAIGLASSDLARAVQRSAPLAQTLGDANFADNFTTKWNQLTQKITADPTSKDVPKIRRELYNMANDLDQSATPFIKNQLDDMEELGFTISPDVRKRELGETLPDLPFIDSFGVPDSTTMRNPKLGANAPGKAQANAPGGATLRWDPQTNSLVPVQ